MHILVNEKCCVELSGLGTETKTEKGKKVYRHFDTPFFYVVHAVRSIIVSLCEIT